MPDASTAARRARPKSTLSAEQKRAKRRTRALPELPQALHPEVLYRWPIVRQLIPYCDVQARRLQAQGKFPLHIRVGAHRMWLGKDIIAWREKNREPVPLPAETA